MNRLYWWLLIVCMILLPFKDYGQRRAKYELKSDKDSTPPVNLKPTVKKEIYRIDFLLPLYLDNLPHQQQVIRNIPAGSLTGINFYEGILLAIDSLEKAEGMYYDIYVHDIATTPVKDLISNGVMDSTDVIVGAIYSNDIPPVAQFAKTRGITFISALSPADAEIRNNPFFILVQPTLETHLKKMIHFIEYNKSYLNTLLLYGGNSSEEKPFKTLKGLLDRQHQTFKYADNKITAEHIKYYLQKDKKNLIYTCIVDPGEAEQLLKQLAPLAEEYPMEIVGYPSWKGLPVLTDGSLSENISVYISYPFRFDEEVDKRLYLSNQYEQFKRGIPSELVYRGFETTLWIADALKNYGTIFNNDLTEMNAFSTQYKISWKADPDLGYYYENNNLYIYRYYNGSLYIVE